MFQADGGDCRTRWVGWQQPGAASCGASGLPEAAEDPHDDAAAPESQGTAGAKTTGQRQTWRFGKMIVMIVIKCDFYMFVEIAELRFLS